MRQEVEAGRSGALPSPFSIYLRTGRRLPAATEKARIEVKFNPYHDPRDGRFTFAPGGGAGGGGGTSGNRGSATRSKTDPRNPGNYSVHVVKKGDTLSKIAASRKGLTPADLAWLNGIPVDGTLKPGQELKVPDQRYLDDGKRARETLYALDFYQRTHGGKLPPDVAHPPSIVEQVSAVVRTETRNGYSFDLDFEERMQRVRGNLHLDPSQGRSKRNQTGAGGTDRRPGDHGGHYIARRFGGPTDAFNHFAQDANFNQGSYRALEDIWTAKLRQGHKVYVRITPEYEGISLRPSSIDVYYEIDGVGSSRKFVNGKGGR